MSNKLYDLVSSEAIATFWTEVNSNRIPYLGETLFPAQKKLGLDLSWIKGHKGLPIALKTSEFDATAELRDRIGVSKIETEMPFFREAMKIKEKDRQELLKLQEASPGYYETFIREIFNDRGQLLDGAIVQGERMRMQLLQGGTIKIGADGIVYEYDFDQNGKYQENNTMKLEGENKWTDHENSNPIADLQEAMRIVEEMQGTTISRAIMSSKTWNNLIQNKSIRMDMNVLQGDRIILTDTMLRQYIIGKLGLTIAVYNKRYKDENGKEGSFYQDGNVTLIPDGNLGNTWYGTTPEEADLLSGSDAEVSIVNTGIAVTTYKQEHPVNVNTVVSQIVLPSFERMHETFLMKVFSENEGLTSPSREVVKGEAYTEDIYLKYSLSKLENEINSIDDINALEKLISIDKRERAKKIYNERLNELLAEIEGDAGAQ